MPSLLIQVAIDHGVLTLGFSIVPTFIERSYVFINSTRYYQLRETRMLREYIEMGTQRVFYGHTTDLPVLLEYFLASGDGPQATLPLCLPSLPSLLFAFL